MKNDRVVRRVNLAPDVLDSFRLRLASERHRVLRTVAGADEELATLDSHQAGATADDVDRELARTILGRLEAREKQELDEIEAARQRLEKGSFGLCEACGRPISLARLNVMPAARYCVSCQERRERGAEVEPKTRQSGRR